MPLTRPARSRVLLTAAVAVLVAAHLGWEHLDGGVRSHHLLDRADLPANLFENDKTRFYLAFESEQKGAELFARLSRTGKIASMDEMPRLLSAALFGLKIDLLPVPPEELPQKSPNTTYFLVDTTHPFWQMIKNGRNIAVFSDLPPDSTVIKLFPVATQD